VEQASAREEEEYAAQQEAQLEELEHQYGGGGTNREFDAEDGAMDQNLEMNPNA
jgi:hypothetical protein